MRRILLFLILILLFSAPAKAGFFEFPEVMVGQTELTVSTGVSSYKVFGGFNGNQVVLNNYPDVLYGFKADLAKCDLGETARCYLSYTEPAGLNIDIDTMTSRTYINDEPKTETAALYFRKQVDVIGDAYSQNGYLSNFAFWGRNLAQSGNDSLPDSATWKIGGYALNSQAQSAMTGEQFAEFQKKVEVLATEAKIIDERDLNQRKDWYLQCDGLNYCPLGSDKRDNTQEGGVWMVKEDEHDADEIVKIDHHGHSEYNYHGKGTLIIRGNLEVAKDKSIVPANSDIDSLGIIVLK